MGDQGIEKKLQESADKVKKEFDLRQDILKKRLIERDESVEKITIHEAVPVTATIKGNNCNETHSNKRGILLIALLAVSILTLGIVLPFVLKTNKSESFFFASDLYNTIVSENEFFNRLSESRIEIIDISEYEASNYILFVTEDNIVKGGGVELFSNEYSCYINLRFYELSVTGIKKPEQDFSECFLDEATIVYKTVPENEVYVTMAFANYNKVNYYLELVSFDDDVVFIFNELFVG